MNRTALCFVAARVRAAAFIALSLLVGVPVCTPPALAIDSDTSSFPKLDLDHDWPWWRGPGRNGDAGTSQLPTRFSDTENVLWRAPVPGRGHASPVVVGPRIFLATAEESTETQSVLAWDRDSGQQLWKTDISRGGFPENNHAKNTEASSTVACDGERVIATFFHHQGVHATALSLDGKILWQKRVGDFNPKRYEYGYAPSPALYRDLVIISAEHDGDSYIVALKREDGSQVWRAERPRNITFSSPAIGHVAGRDQLLISGAEHIAAYDPATGTQLWRATGTTAATCGTMVWAGDIALASGGYPKAETLAVRADGSGQVLWKNNQKCYEQSMIVSGDYLYALTDAGIAICWRISDGQEMWKERLRGPVSASPILADGKIYWANELGTLYVFAANPREFQLLAENRVGDETMASPAVSGNRMFLRVARQEGPRRQEYLLAIGEK
jgi:outer membrane protein assembly factor BamB